jgi:hypothetical protein
MYMSPLATSPHRFGALALLLRLAVASSACAPTCLLSQVEPARSCVEARCAGRPLAEVRGCAEANCVSQAVDLLATNGRCFPAVDCLLDILGACDGTRNLTAEDLNASTAACVQDCAPFDYEGCGAAPTETSTTVVTTTRTYTSTTKGSFSGMVTLHATITGIDYDRLTNNGTLLARLEDVVRDLLAEEVDLLKRYITLSIKKGSSIIIDAEILVPPENVVNQVYDSVKALSESDLDDALERAIREIESIELVSDGEEIRVVGSIDVDLDLTVGGVSISGNGSLDFDIDGASRGSAALALGMLALLGSAL